MKNLLNGFLSFSKSQDNSNLIKLIKPLPSRESSLPNTQLDHTFPAEEVNRKGNMATANSSANNRIAQNKEGSQLEATQWYELGSTLMSRHAFQDATLAFMHASADPLLRGRALNNIAAILMEMGKLIEAERYLQEAMLNEPKLASAHCNLGIVLQETGRRTDARKCYQNALNIDPQSPATLCNLALLELEDGNSTQATQFVEKAIMLDPHNPGARYTRGLIRLLAFDFSHGWIDYEYRQCRTGPIKSPVDTKVWQGESLTDKTILVICEQGIGDQIMFSSCLIQLSTQARHCILTCHMKLAHLFRISFKSVDVLSEQDAKTKIANNKVDFVVPIGSLGRFFRQDIKDFPRHNGYLHPETHSISFWQEKLRKLGSGLKIGLSWRGGTEGTRSKLRSIPLEYLAPIINIESLHFINLQYTDCTNELVQFSKKHNKHIHTWPEAISDYHETAAIIHALDLVISVQTSVVHLAGALGKTVWVLVPNCPEWRYGNSGESMPWYPSARLFRQKPDQGWEYVIQEICSALIEHKTHQTSKKSSML